MRHLLSHTSGITGLENEEMMEYYGAIGNDRATLIQRYFMTDDPDVKKQALGEVRKVLGTLVTISFFGLSTKTLTDYSSLSRSSLSLALIGNTGKALIGQVNL